MLRYGIASARTAQFQVQATAQLPLRERTAAVDTKDAKGLHSRRSPATLPVGLTPVIEELTQTLATGRRVTELELQLAELVARSNLARCPGEGPDQLCDTSRPLMPRGPLASGGSDGPVRPGSLRSRRLRFSLHELKTSASALPSSSPRSSRVSQARRRSRGRRSSPRLG